MLQQVIAEVRLYHEQARLIVAGRLLAAVDRYLESGQNAGRAEVKAARALVGGELKSSFDELRQRAAECASTLDDWHSVSAVNVTNIFGGVLCVALSTCPGHALVHIPCTAAVCRHM